MKALEMHAQRNSNPMLCIFPLNFVYTLILLLRNLFCKYTVLAKSFSTSSSNYPCKNVCKCTSDVKLRRRLDMKKSTKRKLKTKLLASCGFSI